MDRRSAAAGAPKANLLAGALRRKVLLPNWPNALISVIDSRCGFGGAILPVAMTDSDEGSAVLTLEVVPLPVTDIDVTLAFYTKMVGFTEPISTQLDNS